MVEKVGLPFIPWYPSSFLSSTRGWSVTTKGVYRELLDAQWEIGGLPADPAEIQELIGATKAEFKDWISKIEPKFPICVDGLRRNRKLEAHRSRSLGLREGNRKGAAKTNAKRWGANVVRLPNAGGTNDQ